MKKLILIIMVFAVFACKKEKKSDTPPDSATPLNFISLTVSDSILYVNIPTTITATATGDELTYTWSAEWGTFIGSGAVVQWSACHAATFVITCKVEDKYHQSQTKNLNVKVK